MIFRHGFTYTELIVIMGLILSLLAFTAINLSRPQISASISSTSTQLIADLRAQQQQTMSGSTNNAGQISSFGIYFEPHQYTLFRGSSYSPTDGENFVTTVSSPLSLSSTFPGSVVVFTPLSGEIAGYTSGFDTVTLSHSESPDTRVIQLNRYGVVTEY